jgi:hypothetical protein
MHDVVVTTDNDDLFSSRHCFKIFAYSSKNKSLRACASSPLEPDGKYNEAI